MSNGTPRITMGNGEGFTTLILTDAESRLIRKVLFPEPGTTGFAALGHEACDAFNRGVQRATARIADEFAAEQKARKAGR